MNSSHVTGGRQRDRPPLVPIERRGGTTLGGVRKGAAGHDVCFTHPKSTDDTTWNGEGVLIELVQAPGEVLDATNGTP